MNKDFKQAIEKAVMAFQANKLLESALNLFTTLGYNTKRSLPLHNPSWKGFKNDFVSPGSGFNEKNALVTEWKEVQLLFQLTAEDMKEQLPGFQSTVDRKDPASFLFFAIELTGNEYSRNTLAAIAREINRLFPMDVFVLFKYDNLLSLSLIERRPHKKIMDKDVIEKVTHIYNINSIKPHAAHIQILYTFSFAAIEAEGRRKKLDNFKDLQDGWKKVVSTQILNKEFYLDYSQLSVQLIKAIHPKQVKNKLSAHQGVLNLLNRVMFIYFVQKKEWIMQDDNFLRHFWLEYLKAGNDGNDEFHEKWLNSVFFSAFNAKAHKDAKSIKALPEPYRSAMIYFPYLNGGLFAKNDEYDSFTLTDKHFHEIFNFFESYIFTITEDTPYDVNLEISPELLGKMYEGMINATDLDDVDAEHGIIYTERPEINFMVRRSLVEVLEKKIGDKFSRVFLYHFAFDDAVQKTELLHKYKADAALLRSTVLSITACDPACGSGSMLLGVIQVQMELLRVLDAYMGKPHTPKDDFVIKKQLISECIYGVDIKEWAVRIAELRLWLYMIAEADFKGDELTKAPLLPNLDFKLRCGNSLLQKFGDLDFTIEDLFKGKRKTAGAAKQLNDYIKKKKTFILNQAESNTTYFKLKEEERAVFLDFIRELISEKELSISKRKVSQGSMFGSSPKQADMFEEETVVLKQEVEQLKQLRQFIVRERRLPFSYDIDFMEIFVVKEDNPGFDLVIGNPPYVRQEEILPPDDGRYLEKLMKPENRTLKATVNKEYKEELSDKVFKTYPFLAATIKTEIEGRSKTIPVYGTKVPGRSDLYVYFQLLCPHYLNKQGTFCFIVSNSWLDVDFGSFAQQFLLKHTRLHAVYDCHIRSFEAAVNTIIYLHGSLQFPVLQGGRGGMYKLAEAVNNTTRFIMNKIDYTQAAYAPLMIDQEKGQGNTFNELYRSIPISQGKLLQEAVEKGGAVFNGGKWGGKYFKSPDILFKIFDTKKDILAKLKTVADIDYGMKPGKVDFFYIDSKKQEELQIEKKYLYPIVNSSQKLDSIFVDKVEYVFNCQESKAALKGTNALKYIQWGERNEMNVGKSVEANSPYWYSVQVSDFDFLLLQFWDKRFWTPIAKRKLACSNNFFYGKFHEKDIIGKTQLNSSFYFLQVEVFGRSNQGEGILTTYGYDLGFINLIRFDKIDEQRCETALEEISKRNVLDIFSELGFDRRLDIRAQTPNPPRDRRALDNILFEALKLTGEERYEVYWSIAELVKQRLDKAASR